MDWNHAGDALLWPRRPHCRSLRRRASPRSVRAGNPHDSRKLTILRRLALKARVRVANSVLQKGNAMLQTRGNIVTWLGHAAFRLTTPSGKIILIDPWLKSNPACPESLKNFEKIDIMLVTHGHFDHIADAVDLAKKHKPQIVAMPETCGWLESQGRQELERHEQGWHAKSRRDRSHHGERGSLRRNSGWRQDGLRWRTLRLHCPSARWVQGLSRRRHSRIR